MNPKALADLIEQRIAEALAPLADRVSALEQRPPVPGPPGPRGRPGKDGAAGRDWTPEPPDAVDAVH